MIKLRHTFDLWGSRSHPKPPNKAKRNTSTSHARTKGLQCHAMHFRLCKRWWPHLTNSIACPLRPPEKGGEEIREKGTMLIIIPHHSSYHTFCHNQSQSNGLSFPPHSWFMSHLKTARYASPITSVGFL